MKTAGTSTASHDETLYRLVVENSLDYITIWDAQGRTVYDNPATRHLREHENQRSEEPALFGSLAHPDDRERVTRQFRYLTVHGGSLRVEYRLLLPSGEIRWVDAIVFAVPDASGKTERVIWMRRDISERREWIEKLSESEQRFRRLADNTQDIFLLIGPDGRYQYVSPSFYRIFEIDMASGTPVGMHVHPDDQQHVQNSLRDLLTKGTAQQIEYRVIRPNGQVLWLEAHAEPVLSVDGEVLAGSVVARDVSQRRVAEEKLAASEAQYRLLADNTEDFIQLLDARGRVLFESPSISRSLGPPPEQGSRLSMVVPEDQARVQEAFDKVLNLGTTQTIEFRIEPMPGKIRWLEAIGKPVDARPGAEPTVLSVSRDITQRKLAEEQALQSQKLEAIGQLTGSLAHDFNNLLGVVIGNLDLLEDGLPPDDGLRRRLDTARDAALKAAKVTQSLLSAARRQPMVVVSEDLNALVEEARPLIVTSAGKAIRLNIALVPGLIPVRCDASVFGNVLLNLVINARDAMQAAAPDSPVLDISTSREMVGADPELPAGEYGVLWVKDNGTGMPPHVISKAFEPFFTTKSRGKGTGLGLAMVYGYARQLGGSVRIESAVGRGTTIKVYLPITDNAQTRTSG